jgi:hypothetical protein
MKVVGPLKVLLYSYVPVVVSIYIMILVRSQDLANETLNAGLEPGFFNPVTASDAISSGFIIWTFGALFVGFLALMLYWILKRYAGFKNIHYLGMTLVLAFIMSAGLFINKVPFAPEGTFEMFSCGIGFGILIPHFYGREITKSKGI